jgi:uncharacterized membrane protein
MSRDLTKTLSYLSIHFALGFTVAYLFTGSLFIASGIALVEPVCNAAAYFFHEKLWNAWAPLRGAAVATKHCNLPLETGAEHEV